MKRPPRQRQLSRRQQHEALLRARRLPRPNWVLYCNGRGDQLRLEKGTGRLCNSSAKLLATPFVALPIVGNTEAAVSDACDNQAFIDTVTTDEVQWIEQATTNLNSVVNQAKKSG